VYHAKKGRSRQNCPSLRGGRCRKRSQTNRRGNPHSSEASSDIRVIRSCEDCHVGSVGRFERGTDLLAMTEVYCGVAWIERVTPKEVISRKPFTCSGALRWYQSTSRIGLVSAIVSALPRQFPLKVYSLKWP
jgi:hypothetical protein